MSDQFNEAAREFNEALARKGPECATANGTNYATLTIGGVVASVCNVVFYDDVDVSIDGVRVDATGSAIRVNGAEVPLKLSPIVLTTYSEWTPAFQAWHDRIMAAPMLASPRRPWRRGANHPGEAPRWYRLRTKRGGKAKAKRTKMRAARYAARWEQAHLRVIPALSPGGHDGPTEECGAFFQEAKP